MLRRKTPAERCTQQPRQHGFVRALTSNKKDIQRKGHQTNHGAEEPFRLRLRLHTVPNGNWTPSLRLQTKGKLVRRRHTKKLLGSHEEPTLRRLHHAHRVRRKNQREKTNMGTRPKQRFRKEKTGNHSENQATKNRD